MNEDCIDGSVRLVGGANGTLGLVEVCINNLWGGVCIDRFGTNDAEVVCNQLGFFQKGGSLICLSINGIFDDINFPNRKLHCLS